jgi:hypothetical protein
MRSTLKITIKGEEYKKLIDTYDIDPFVDEPPKMERDNLTVQKYLKILLDEFRGEPDNIIITATMILK